MSVDQLKSSLDARSLFLAQKRVATEVGAFEDFKKVVGEPKKVPQPAALPVSRRVGLHIRAKDAVHGPIATHSSVRHLHHAISDRWRIDCRLAFAWPWRIVFHPDERQRTPRYRPRNIQRAWLYSGHVGHCPSHSSVAVGGSGVTRGAPSQPADLEEVGASIALATPQTLHPDAILADVKRLRKSGLSLTALQACDCLLGLKVVVAASTASGVPLGPAGLYLAAEATVVRALEQISDDFRGAANALLGVDTASKGKPIGDRQKLAAQRCHVSTDAFRHNYESRVLQAIVEALVHLEGQYSTQAAETALKSQIAHTSEEAQRDAKRQVDQRRSADSASEVADEVPSAHSLRERHLVGLLLPDSSNPFFARVGFSFERALRESGVDVMICSSEGQDEAERSVLEQFRARRIDGLVYIPTARPVLLLDLLNAPFPILVFDRKVNADGVDFIGFNSREGTLTAVEYLVRLGHRRIGYLRGPAAVETARERFDSFTECMASLGLDIDKRFIFSGDYSAHAGRDCASQLLRLASAQRPTAMLVANDLMAIGLMQRLQQAHWRLPDDLSVIGFDDIEWSRWVHPALTTIAQPVAEIVQRGAELLMNRMKEYRGGRAAKPEPTVEVFIPMLVTRESVGIPRSSVTRGHEIPLIPRRRVGDLSL
jgi:LacI family transcriptional regulator